MKVFNGERGLRPLLSKGEVWGPRAPPGSLSKLRILRTVAQLGAVWRGATCALEQSDFLLALLSLHTPQICLVCWMGRG